MYKINKEDIIKKKEECYEKFIGGLVSLTFFIIMNLCAMFFVFKDANKYHFNEFTIWCILLFLIFLPVFKDTFFSNFIKLKRINKKLKEYSYLEQNGTIYRNVKCDIKKKLELLDNRTIYNVNVKYIESNGNIIILTQEISNCPAFKENDSTIDVLIDEKNINNYYLGFDIKEINN